MNKGVLRMAIIPVLLLFSLPLKSHTSDTGDLDQSDVWKAMSPDNKFYAAVRRWPSNDWQEFFKTDTDNFRIVVFSEAKNGLEQAIYAKWTCDYNRIPAQIQWSPDSKFLVITTRNAGGHHPYICTSYVFCTSDRSFRIIDSDPSIGQIGDTKFEFVGPDKITMNHLNDNLDQDIPFSFSLSKEVSKMRKLN